MSDTPAHTPSQAAFSAALDAIPGITHRFAVFGDEPTEVIEGQLAGLEIARASAEASGLYVSYGSRMPRLDVHGFSQRRRFASFSFCGACNGELTLTGERTSGLCTDCAGKGRS